MRRFSAFGHVALATAGDAGCLPIASMSFPQSVRHSLRCGGNKLQLYIPPVGERRTLWP
jgi:hypothetical protein